MKLSPQIKIILVLLTFCLGACGSSAEPLGGGLLTGEVVPLNFEAQDSAALQFEELSGSEEFALILFGSNLQESATSFQISSDLGSLARSLETSVPENEMGTAPQDWEGFLREEEKKLQGLQPYEISSEAKAIQEKTKSLTLGSCAQGLGQWFKVLNQPSDTTSFQQVCGILRRSSSNAYYYVDQEVDSQLADADLNIAIDTFEARIDIVRNMIGAESDLDENGHFYVLFTPGVNRMGSKTNTVVTGFFFAGDLHAVEDIPSSNQAEILYISVPDENSNTSAISLDLWKSNIATTVVTHEFQHLVNYNQKVLKAGGEGEDTWANEGLSHFFEDLDPNTLFDHVSAENPARVAYFLETPQQAHFTQGTDLPKRGGAYLFFRYLYEQADLGRWDAVPNGEEFLRRLVQSPKHGIENIETVTGVDFGDLLRDFYAAVQLSDTGLNDDSRYNFSGICLTCDQDDHRGTQLRGVQLEDLQQVPSNFEIQNPAPLFLKISGALLQSQESRLTIRAPGGNAAGNLIRIH